jgi:L-fucose mutarotase
MLIDIDPILSPELLHTLRAMGHGDEIVIADANFPGTTMAKRLLRADGISATRMLDAVLTVLPLDDFVTAAAHVMQVVGNPLEKPDIVAEFETQIADRSPVGSIERFAFYDRARAAFAVIQTGETRLYGNIILTKGVIRA